MDLIPDIAGRTVTADALLTQTAIAACLHRRGARFMLIAKGNQKNLLREVRGHFSSQPPRKADFMTRSPQPEHGRIEQREIWISTDPVHRIVFPWAGQVFMIRRTVREYRCARNGKPATTGDPSAGTGCGITSHTPETAGAEALLRLNRGHWSCERVHRILDDTAMWNEDRCRVRSGHGPENLSCLRRLAIGLIIGRGRPVAPDGQAAGPEPAHGARLAPAHPEHAATREARRLTPDRPGQGPRNLPGNAGQAVRHARGHAQGGRNRRQDTEPPQEQPDPMPDGHPARHRNRRIRNWRQRTPQGPPGKNSPCPAGRQPCRHLLQIPREGAERTHRLRAAVRTGREVAPVLADAGPGPVPVHDLQAPGPFPFAWHRIPLLGQFACPVGEKPRRKSSLLNEVTAESVPSVTEAVHGSGQALDRATGHASVTSGLCNPDSPDDPVSGQRTQGPRLLLRQGRRSAGGGVLLSKTPLSRWFRYVS